MLKGRKIIALCIAGIGEMTSYDLIVTLNNKITKLGYTLFVYATTTELGDYLSSIDGQAAVFELMDFSIIDALIVFGDKIKDVAVVDSIIERAKAHGTPIAVLGGERPGCTRLAFDHTCGFEMLTRHIVEEHKISNIHFLAGDKGNSYSEQRISALKKVLDENNILFDESMISYCSFCYEPAEKAVNDLIDKNNIPEAVICANDVMAMAAVGVFVKRGIKVPDDVMVTGYDGISEIEFTSPRITSVTCSYRAMAEKLAELLPDIIDGKLKNRSFAVQPELILSESCGCSTRDSINSAEYMNLLNDRLYRYSQESTELAELSVKMQVSDSFGQISALLNGKLFYDMSCILNKDCTDETVSPLDYDKAKGFIDEESLLIYENTDVVPFIPHTFNSKDIIPHLDYFMERDRFFIFTSLHYLDTPIGYLCFYFREQVYESFLRIPQVINTLNNGIGGYRNIKHKNYLMNKIDEMYRTDTLTGLLNRRGFSLEYQRLLDSDPDTSLTVVLADLDKLKYINDNFGHEDGDIAIKATADALRTACPSDALCVRFGGDEMIAVCKGSVDIEELKKKFHGFFTEFNANSDKSYTISASIGAYCYEHARGLGMNELIECPDRLMYLEKHKGKS
ncbi:MAG: GGDEF domain-containing protein [Ruminiclostridium sp.]|nr:GGDEF domain-containing protein [Ruminiclostridium sp.]